MKAESTEKVQREHVAATSGDLLETQIARLREVFPEVVVEGKIDWEKLRITLGAAAESGPGRFLFSWAGRDDAVSLLQTPSRATLIPCPAESLNYESTGNAFIEGDNLEVLKLLFKPYFGRVKLIYIDPPYNTGQDFVYPDNYADPLKTYLQITGQVDAEGNLLTSNPETSGRYHSAWLSMMYPRLFLARQLLREDGVICISIDDHEMHHLRILMNEIFGEENFVATIVVQANKRGQTYKDISKTHEYLLMYSQSTDPSLQELQKQADDLPFQDSVGPFDLWELRNRNPKFGRHNRPNLFFPIYVCPAKTDENGLSKISLEPTQECDIEIYPRNSQGEDGCWRWQSSTVRKADLTSTTPDVVAKRRRDGGWNIYERSRKSTTKPKSIWDETSMISEQGTIQMGELGLGAYFDHPKPIGLIRKILEITTSEEDLVVDFFAGSSTTAHAVLELNRDDGASRNFVMVQLPEPTTKPPFRTIADIGKERIRRAILRLDQEGNGALPLKQRQVPEDRGFKVFKLRQPNIQQWPAEEERDPEAFAQKLSLFNDPLVPGWKPENVIWEVALREGFSLNTRFAIKELPNGNKVYEVTDPDSGQQFWISLDEQIRADLIKQCELTLDRIFICRDVALDDSAAANLALQCRLKTI
jgi:adenine-specific DNA-methyltransferase